MIEPAHFRLGDSEHPSSVMPWRRRGSKSQSCRDTSRTVDRGQVSSMHVMLGGIRAAVRIGEFPWVDNPRTTENDLGP